MVSAATLRSFVQRLGTASVGLLMVFVSGLALNACGPRSANCFPAPLTVTPEIARAGSTVVISAVAANCALGYRNKVYVVTSASPGRADVRVATIPVADDGSFRAEVQIPSDALAGPHGFHVSGSPRDHCPDGESCPGYWASVTVVE